MSDWLADIEAEVMRCRPDLGRLEVQYLAGVAMREWLAERLCPRSVPRRFVVYESYSGYLTARAAGDTPPDPATDRWYEAVHVNLPFTSENVRDAYLAYRKAQCAPSLPSLRSERAAPSPLTASAPRQDGSSSRSGSTKKRKRR